MTVVYAPCYLYLPIKPIGFFLDGKVVLDSRQTKLALPRRWKRARQV
jgi:hypothetical protein